jgi:uncharacterized membrane protein
MERRLSSRRTKTVFYFLALASGILYAISVASDVFVYRVFLPNPIAFALAEQWTALLFTVIMLVILSIPTNRERRRSLGTKFDRTFAHIALPSRKVIIDIVIAGIFAGVSTFAYYYVVGSSGDVSAVLPFSRFSLIYLMIGDLILIRDYPTIIEGQSLLAITLGVILVGLSPGSIDLSLLLFVIIIWGGGVAISVFFQSRAKRRKIRPHTTMDSLNLRLWLLLFLNFIMTLLMIPFITPEVILLLMTQFLTALPWLLLPIGFTFFSIIAYLQALGKGKMSVVQGISSISIILGIPINILGAFILPGVFVMPAADFIIWFLRLAGTVFVISGIIALSMSEMRGYILVHLKPDAGDIMPKLKRIHGVTRVSAIAGIWNLLIRIDIRSLGSARVKTLRKIEETLGVSDMVTMLILKEWE